MTITRTRVVAALIAVLLPAMVLLLGQPVAAQQKQKPMSAKEKKMMEMKAKADAKPQVTSGSGSLDLINLSDIVHTWHVARAQQDTPLKQRQESLIRIILEQDLAHMAPYMQQAQAEVSHSQKEQDARRPFNKDSTSVTLAMTQPKEKEPAGEKPKISDELMAKRSDQRRPQIAEHNRTLYYDALLEKRDIANQLLAAGNKPLTDDKRAQLYDQYVALSKREAELAPTMPRESQKDRLKTEKSRKQ